MNEWHGLDSKLGGNEILGIKQIDENHEDSND